MREDIMRRSVMRRYFKKSCAMLLAAAMAFGSLSGINVNAAETPDAAKNTLDDSKKGFDAYRTPFLSGTLKTWIYQGWMKNRRGTRLKKLPQILQIVLQKQILTI